jgi:D-arginine dehydrogenase
MQGDGQPFDVAIVGAGIAGASLAYRLAPQRRVLLLEAEAQPGTHSTGRSAAMFMASYGTPQVRALTRASRAFYEQPPAGFADTPLLAPRGALYVAWCGQEAELAATLATLRATGTAIEVLDAPQTLARVPVLKAEGLLGGLFEPDAMDIDVHALHQGFLRGARAKARSSGATPGWPARSVSTAPGNWPWPTGARPGPACWSMRRAPGPTRWPPAPVRRAAACSPSVAPPSPSACPRASRRVAGQPWPRLTNAGTSSPMRASCSARRPTPTRCRRTTCSPKNWTSPPASPPSRNATTLTIRRPRRTWAGLRSFAPDGDLVIGFDPGCPASSGWPGQGGYGIQSAAGVSLLAANLLLEQPLDPGLQREGVAPDLLSPARAGLAG